MTTGYPTPLATWETETEIAPARAQTNPAPADGSWRYRSRRGSRLALASAIVVSASLHAFVLCGGKWMRRTAAVTKPVEDAPVIRLVVPPEIKELEEPERTADNENESAPDLAIPVPMQADVPQLPRPSDFVQPLNFASMLEQPELNTSNLKVIPEHFTRSARLAESVGKIFNLGDLDRAPEPVLQPPPVYPVGMRKEGLSATVSVEFVVDAQGRVIEPVVIDSTRHEFDDAAVNGVAKWKFRAGWKGGRKVNVRMRVPIVFKVIDGE